LAGYSLRADLLSEYTFVKSSLVLADPRDHTWLRRLVIAAAHRLADNCLTATNA
jgi:hypothetical protein